MRALLVLLAACAPRFQGPQVVVHLVEPAAWSKADQDTAASAIVTWQDLGFTGHVETFEERTTTPCPRDWYARKPQVTKCVIDVGIIKEDKLVDDNMRGGTDRSTGEVYIDAGLHGFDLLHVIAHELGHVLLDTAKHSTKGVMLGGGWDWMLSDEDKALACETIKRGCK